MLDEEQIKHWNDDKQKPAKTNEPPKPAEPKPLEPPKQAASEQKAHEPVMAEPQAEPPPKPYGEALPTGEHVRLTPEQAKARNRRGQWIAIGLFAFVIIIFVLTMTKMGANIMVRDL
jgi:hypothetical protein